MMTVDDWARLILTTLSILAIVGGGIAERGECVTCHYCIISFF